MADRVKPRLSDADRAAIDRFLRRLYRGEPRYFTASEREHSYPQWIKGDRAWRSIHQGGTGIMLALMWYHHVSKPGSREWRPKVMIDALLEAATEPAEMERPEPLGWGDRVDDLGRPIREGAAS